MPRLESDGPSSTPKKVKPTFRYPSKILPVLCVAYKTSIRGCRLRDYQYPIQQ